MEITEEKFLADDTPREEEILKESFPLPWEATVREFEDYLLDIGVRV